MDPFLGCLSPQLQLSSATCRPSFRCPEMSVDFGESFVFSENHFPLYSSSCYFLDSVFWAQRPERGPGTFSTGSTAVVVGQSRANGGLSAYLGYEFPVWVLSSCLCLWVDGATVRVYGCRLRVSRVWGLTSKENYNAVLCELLLSCTLTLIIFIKMLILVW